MQTDNHNSNLRSHLKDLLLLFGIPFSIVLILAGFVYVPRMLADPQYDFIYCEGFSCDEVYSVDTFGKIRFKPTSDRYSYRTATLYYYDIERDSTHKIETTEALSYRVDESSKSPDGYILRQNTGGGGFLLFNDYQNYWSLSKGMASKPINLDRGSYGNKNFLGWVLSNER